MYFEMCMCGSVYYYYIIIYYKYIYIYVCVWLYIELVNMYNSIGYFIYSNHVHVYNKQFYTIVISYLWTHKYYYVLSLSVLPSSRSMAYNCRVCMPYFLGDKFIFCGVSLTSDCISASTIHCAALGWSILMFFGSNTAK